MRIQAVTALAYYSQRDVQVNTLRATLAAFGAAIGGADSVTVLPFGAASGIWDKAGCRLARNTHIILAEESGLGQVIDPAGGSWFVEQFSEDLAAKGWEALQEIERRGGIGAILASGWAAAEVERTWHRRLHNIVRRKDALTGVSEFPNLTDPAPPASLDASSDRQTNPFPLRRHSAPFEHLRDAADLPTQRPSVFLAALGPLSAHGPRAQFAMNFFAAGGIAAENSNGEGFNSAAEVAAAFGLTAPRPPLVVICSSDQYYAEHAVSTAQALKASGCTRLYLAGNPGERRAEFESAGVDEFVYIGCDAIDVLGRALQASGIEITGNAEANAR